MCHWLGPPLSSHGLLVDSIIIYITKAELSWGTVIVVALYILSLYTQSLCTYHLCPLPIQLKVLTLNTIHKLCKDISNELTLISYLIKYHNNYCIPCM